jgi:CubicO group peptidase (beta-lactamase class C family)
MSYSVAKPLATLTLLVVMAEHELDLDDRVTAVWPEYGAAGKETTTLRHLLRHAAGLYCFRRRRPHSSRTTLLRWWT